MTTASSELTPKLDDIIDHVQSTMLTIDADSEEYPKLVDMLSELYKIKADKAGDRFSKDAMLAVFGNLAGILLIINYERVHVVTSKALGFIIKTRL